MMITKKEFINSIMKQLLGEEYNKINIEDIKDNVRGYYDVDNNNNFPESFINESLQYYTDIAQADRYDIDMIGIANIYKLIEQYDNKNMLDYNIPLNTINIKTKKLFDNVINITIQCIYQYSMYNEEGFKTPDFTLNYNKIKNSHILISEDDIINTDDLNIVDDSKHFIIKLDGSNYMIPDNKFRIKFSDDKHLSFVLPINPYISILINPVLYRLEQSGMDLYDPELKIESHMSECFNEALLNELRKLNKKKINIIK